MRELRCLRGKCEGQRCEMCSVKDVQCKIRVLVCVRVYIGCVAWGVSGAGCVRAGSKAWQ